MKINENYQIHSIAGEHIVIANNKEQADFTRIFSLNSTALWLWEELYGKEFTEQEAVDLLLHKYYVDINTAASDIKKWIKLLKEHNILEL